MITPLSLSPLLWSELGQGVTVASDLVTQVSDLSGNGRHLTPPSAGTKPLYVAGGPHGPHTLTDLVGSANTATALSNTSVVLDNRNTSLVLVADWPATHDQFSAFCVGANSLECQVLDGGAGFSVYNHVNNTFPSYPVANGARADNGGPCLVGFNFTASGITFRVGGVTYSAGGTVTAGTLTGLSVGGNQAGTNNNMRGRLFAAGAFSALTDAQYLSLEEWARARFDARTAFSSELLVLGDSIATVNASQGLATWVRDLGIGRDTVLRNIGRGGRTLADLDATFGPNALATLDPATAGRRAAIIQGGINDLTAANTTAAVIATLGKLASLAGKCRQAGYRVAATTLLYRVGYVDNANIDAYNAGVKALLASGGLDAVIDWQTDPALASPTTYQAGTIDGTHPTAAQMALMSRVARTQMPTILPHLPTGHVRA